MLEHFQVGARAIVRKKCSPTSSILVLKFKRISILQNITRNNIKKNILNHMVIYRYRQINILNRAQG